MSDETLPVEGVTDDTAAAETAQQDTGNETQTPPEVEAASGKSLLETESERPEGLPEEFASVTDLVKALEEATAPKNPETADGYKFEFDQGVVVDEPFLEGFKAAAMEAGLGPDQAQKVVAFYAAEQAKIAAETDKAVENLRAEALKQFPGKTAEEVTRTASIAIKKFGSPELESLFANPAIGNQPAIVAMLYRVGQSYKEESAPVGKPPAGINLADMSEDERADRFYNTMNK